MAAIAVMAKNIMATQQLSDNRPIPFSKVVEWAKTDNNLQERIGVYTTVNIRRIEHKWIAESNISMRIQLPNGKAWMPDEEVMELNATGQIVEMSYSNRTATIRCNESNIVSRIAE